ncbi:MAG: hypothetical protein EA345_15315 [Halomonas sp.]|nr:MAG: hypothetical protein EA345_15315 [Halomonas sp.]
MRGILQAATSFDPYLPINPAFRLMRALETWTLYDLVMKFALQRGHPILLAEICWPTQGLP